MSVDERSLPCEGVPPAVCCVGSEWFPCAVSHFRVGVVGSRGLPSVVLFPQCFPALDQDLDKACSRRRIRAAHPARHHRAVRPRVTTSVQRQDRRRGSLGAARHTPRSGLHSRRTAHQSRWRRVETRCRTPVRIVGILAVRPPEAIQCQASREFMNSRKNSVSPVSNCSPRSPRWVNSSSRLPRPSKRRSPTEFGRGTPARTTRSASTPR